MEFMLHSVATPFNLDYTLDCGQVLRWGKRGGWWYGVVDGNVMKIRQSGGKLIYHTYPERLDGMFIEHYFRLDDDLPRILSKINRDEKMAQVIHRFHGLRIVRQKPWECLISYICATYKNIPAIKDILLALSRKFGRGIKFDGNRFYAFPTPHVLAKAGTNELNVCKLGYRSPYVFETARRFACAELDLDSLRNIGYEEAKARLLAQTCGHKLLPGVGEKVADCVLLFSLDHLDAFPVDVWVKRAVLEFYPQYLDPMLLEKMSRRKSITSHEYAVINSFGRRYFGEYAGYAQQYLFYYMRERNRER